MGKKTVGLTVESSPGFSPAVVPNCSADVQR